MLLNVASATTLRGKKGSYALQVPHTVHVTNDMLLIRIARSQMQSTNFRCTVFS